VDVVENLGASSIIHARLPDGQVILAEQRGKKRARDGETFEVPVDPAEILIFDQAGIRLR
jgi:lactose/L-arabinose transport system ATP-binding protein